MDDEPITLPEKSSVKFHRIQAIPIGELFNPKEILVFNSNAEQKNEATKRKRSNSDHSEEPHVLRINTGLKGTFPSTLISIPKFKAKLNSIFEKLNTLNGMALKIKREKLKSSFSESIPNTEFDNLCKAKTRASIIALIDNTLRTPTVDEIIDMAVRENMEAATTDLKKLASEKNLGICVNPETNIWSESNLYTWFKSKIKWHSYKLAMADIKVEFCADNSGLGANPSNQPKNMSYPNFFHKRETEQYERDANISMTKNVDENEIILTMSFYHPIRGHKIREYDVLASQTLADIHNVFKCSTEINSLDYSLELNGSVFMLNGILYPNVLNDACDYTKPLIDFFTLQKNNILKSKQTFPQHLTSFESFQLPIYMPGFLLHHGDCEHRIVITAIRKFTRSRDCPYTECYPISIYEAAHKFTKCELCQGKEIEVTLFNSLLFASNPIHLCSKCYEISSNIKLGEDIYQDRGLAQPIAIKYIED
ncbi:snRNA-activating protein complex [Babesia duncani]|uniref:snRNA-activating protein complex n=1 Tax=Babesia duncani TaxID=323732 RepID=A0AAD9PIQ3_9APIC|nr:snRNA-activating protein complex [Babesia duncani]